MKRVLNKLGLRVNQVMLQQYFTNGANRQQLGKTKNPAKTGNLLFPCLFIFIRLLLALMTWHSNCKAYRSSFARKNAVHFNNPLSFTRR